MQDNSSARSEIDPSDDEFHIIYLKEPGRHITRFPRPPEWWDDTDARDRRHVVYSGFDPSDLSGVIIDLASLMDDVPQSADEIASLIRRQWSLAWLNEVASGALLHFPCDDSMEQMVRYWLAKAGTYLAELAWLFVNQQPARLVLAGMRSALITPYDSYEVDDEDD